MGRPFGAKDKKPRDPSACRENAKRPRRRPTRDLREYAKEILGDALHKHGFKHIAQMIELGPGDRDERRFQWACEFAANRIGLPATQVSELTGNALPPVEVVFRLHGEGRAA